MYGTTGIRLGAYAESVCAGGRRAVGGTGKLEMLREIGADHVIDFNEGDFTDVAGDFDIVFDVVGRAPFGRVARLLRPRGRYVVIGSHYIGLPGAWRKPAHLDLAAAPTSPRDARPSQAQAFGGTDGG